MNPLILHRPVKPRLSTAPAHREPARLYLAVSADGIVDEGTWLTPFLAGLLETFGELDEDLAVFLLEEGQAARVVAVLKPSPTGAKIVYV